MNVWMSLIGCLDFLAGSCFIIDIISYHFQLPLWIPLWIRMLGHVGSCWVIMLASWLHYASIFDGAGQAGRRFPPPTRLRAVLGRGEEARSDRFGGLK